MASDRDPGIGWPSRQAIDGTIRFLRERTGLAEFLAQLAHEAMMKALMTEDTNDTDEEE